MNNEERDVLVYMLRQLMADTLTLKLNAQYFHHHVQGINFQELHEYFQDLYEDMEEAYDEIGEQIRILGESAPGSFEEFNRLKSIDSIDPDKNYSTEEMVDTLYHDNDSIRDRLQRCESKANEVGVETILDFFIERHQEHDEHHYFLGSLSANL